MIHVTPRNSCETSCRPNPIKIRYFEMGCLAHTTGISAIKVEFITNLPSNPYKQTVYNCNTIQLVMYSITKLCNHWHYTCFFVCCMTCAVLSCHSSAFVFFFCFFFVLPNPNLTMLRYPSGHYLISISPKQRWIQLVPITLDLTLTLPLSPSLSLPLSPSLSLSFTLIYF